MSEDLLTSLPWLRKHIIFLPKPRGSRYLTIEKSGPKTHDIYVYIYIYMYMYIYLFICICIYEGFKLLI